LSVADLLRLLALSAIWGGSFILLRVASPVLGPVWLIEIRVLLAGLALLLYAKATGHDLQVRTRWRRYLVLGAVNSAIPFTLISAAEMTLDASFAAIVNATAPLWGAIIGAIWIRDVLTRRALLGLGLGVLGVATLVGWGPLPLSPEIGLAVLASLLGAASYGLGSVFTKARMQGSPPIGMAVCSQLSAALVLMPLVPLAPPISAPSQTVIACVLLLSLVSTAFAYLIFFRLVVDVGPTRALTVTFLNPIFGIIWGALFLGEHITASALVGCAVILLGTALVVGVRLPMPRARVVAEAAAGE
jgi:drug/metabolite transporter (DMT)-like permease